MARTTAHISVKVNGQVLEFALVGRLKGEDFDKYRQANKDLGLRWNGQVWTCQVRNFDPSNITAKFAAINLPVEMPEALPANDSTVPAKAGAGIKKLTKGYAINFDHNAQAVAAFNNKSGTVGITVYDAQTKSRITTEMSIVRNAIKVLEDLGFEISLDERVKADIAADAKAQERYLTQAEAVSAVLNSSFKLYPFQNEAIDFLTKTDGNALIGFDMGLGKTLTSLAWVASRGLSALIVCPKVVRLQWLQEAEKFFPGHFVTQNSKTILD